MILGSQAVLPPHSLQTTYRDEEAGGRGPPDGLLDPMALGLHQRERVVRKAIPPTLPMQLQARIASLWDQARHSYWFVPSILVLAAFLLSFLTLEIDRALADAGFRQITGWFYTGSAQGARQLLAAIASSMIGVAGTVFSITIVALTLAANQFGPRLLRNFMRDLGNQIVLGTFLATFLYCLLILRQVHGEEGGDYSRFVPQISISIAVLLAIVSLGVLIFFIHHIAQSIQAPTVIAAIAADLKEVIDDLYPEPIGDTPPDALQHRAELESQLPARLDQDSVEILAGHAGYLQRIEAEPLLKEAQRGDLIVRVDRRPGQFLLAHDVVMHAWPAARVVDGVRESLSQTFSIASQRSHTQDVEFGVDQLVEIALLGLSPGVNDPFTAIMCIDRLAETLSHFAQRAIPSPYREDNDGRLRVIAYPMELPKIIDAAFNQIRQNSSRSLATMIRLLEAFERIGTHLPDEDSRACLRQQADMVYQTMGTGFEEHDRRSVVQAYQAAIATIDQTLERPRSNDRRLMR